jgi:hypothetical protein
MSDLPEKANSALFQAFRRLAEDLALPVRLDPTDLAYDSLAVGHKPLKNALSIKEESTSFYTNDKSLLADLEAAGFTCKRAPFREPSPHDQYRYRVSKVNPSSLKGDHRPLFIRLLRDSVSYVEHPIAGTATSVE